MFTTDIGGGGGGYTSHVEYQHIQGKEKLESNLP